MAHVARSSSFHRLVRKTLDTAVFSLVDCMPVADGGLVRLLDDIRLTQLSDMKLSAGQRDVLVVGTALKLLLFPA